MICEARYDDMTKRNTAAETQQTQHVQSPALAFKAEGSLGGTTARTCLANKSVRAKAGDAYKSHHSEEPTACVRMEPGRPSLQQSTEDSR